MLQPCAQPRLVPDPDTAGDTALALEKVEVAKWGKCNEGRFSSLVAWVRSVLTK